MLSLSSFDFLAEVRKRIVADRRRDFIFAIAAEQLKNRNNKKHTGLSAPIRYGTVIHLLARFGFCAILAAEQRQQIAWGVSPRYFRTHVSETTSTPFAVAAPRLIERTARFSWGSRPRLSAVAAPQLEESATSKLAYRTGMLEKQSEVYLLTRLLRLLVDIPVVLQVLHSHLVLLCRFACSWSRQPLRNRQ